MDSPGEEEHHKDSIRKMAVLFTDIVGSTKFFKLHGDIAGRRMLKEHQDMATPPIVKHGGVVVKMLGDSVMAYFFHPVEALKSAIRIQTQFNKHNQAKGHEGQIHIRLGIHYGDGILEEKDIFGDVVNTAAKFLPMVKGDEICISQAVFDQVQGLPNIRFESAPVLDKELFPNGFNLYRVGWNEGINLAPLMRTLLYFRPLPGMSKGNFLRTWEQLIKEGSRLWTGCIEKEGILSDRSIILIVKDPPQCLSLATKVLDFIKVNLGNDAALFLPMQVIIDSGPFLRGENIALEDLKVNWDAIEPGKIHVSDPVYHSIKNQGPFAAVPSGGVNQTPKFYIITFNREEANDTCLFLYQNALVQGELSPCFYCGDRRHPTSNCPSKKLTELTNGLGRLGYIPLEEINRVFLGFLNGATVDIDADIENHRETNNPSLWAYYGFYELKSVYQLRFFTTIWNVKEEAWNKLPERKGDRRIGGLVWLAQDCIRVSNLEQAESIIKDSITKDPDDYKAYCAMGFVYIEKNDYIQAKFHFKKALERAQSTTQKMLIDFLLSRLHCLQDDAVKSEEMIRKVLRHDPLCGEALYEDILIQFRKGKDAIALHQLIKLIKKNREFYVTALIDPELAKFSKIIHPKLKNLLDEAREEAKRITPKAREALENLRKSLGEGEREFKEAEALLSKIEEMSKVDSYFCHLDVIFYGETLITIAHTGVEGRRKELSRTIEKLANRQEQYHQYLKNFPYKFLINGVERDLRRLQPQINRDWDTDGTQGKFKEVLQAAKNIFCEMDEIKHRIERLEMSRRILTFVTKLFKKSMIIQSVNLIVAIILFPIAVYYLNFILPGLNITPQNIWDYQKGILLLGALSGLLLAIVTTAKNTSRRHT